MIFEHHQRILFIGDSITDSGRGTTAPPYGDGYVNMARNFLLAGYPAYNLTLINKGMGGNTVRNLAARWERDVMLERPNWVSVMIGANDVWRHFAYNTNEAVPLGEYTDTLRRLISRTQAAIRANFILMQPFIVNSDPGNPMRQLMDVYSGSLELLALEFNGTFVRTQAAIDAVLAAKPSTFWSPDQIHLGAAGHMVLAQAWLRAIGYEL